MDILIVIGVLLLLAAVSVMYRQYREQKKIAVLWRERHSVVSETCALQNKLIDLWETKHDNLDEDNAALRNDLHACINARKAKSRGITGKYRKAIEAHKAAFDGARDGTPTQPIDNALWSVLDSEAV